MGAQKQSTNTPSYSPGRDPTPHRQFGSSVFFFFFFSALKSLIPGEQTARATISRYYTGYTGATLSSYAADTIGFEPRSVRERTASRVHRAPRPCSYRIVPTW